MSGSVARRHAPCELVQWPPAPRAAATAHGEDAALAVVALTGSLAVVHAIAAVSVLGTLPSSAMVLAAIAGGHVLLAVGTVRRPTRRVLAAGCLAELLLATGWLVSRTVGLPFADAVPPVGLLDALVAAGELFAALLLLGLVARRGVRAGAVQLALVLAAMSLTSLAGGHTHATAQAGGTAAGPALAGSGTYCRLLD